MSTEPTVIEPPVTEQPVIEQPVNEIPAPAAPIEATPAPVELTYEYQPTDEHGRPIGGRQVIKYRTPDELAKKFEKANIELQRELRKLKKNQRLGIVEEETIPADAPRFDSVVEFNPRELSADERVRLSRDLSDPERFSQASDTLFEATVGAKPQVLRETMNNLQVTNLRLLARIESDAFMAANPDYYKCKENADTLTNWMTKHNLRPIQANFQLAFDTLDAAGLLLKAPNVREEAPVTPTPVSTPAPAQPEVTEQTPVNTQPVQAEPSRITMETPAQPKRPVVPPPTGLTRNQAADTGVARTLSDEIVFEVEVKGRDGKPTGDKKVYKGLAAVERMPSDEYKRRLRFEPGFRQKVEQLEAAAAKR